MTSIVSALGPLKGLKQARSAGPKAVSKPTPLPLQGTAKRNHPEFEKAGIYVRKSTKRAAWRKYEDATGGDFSELVQTLLEEYLAD